MKKHIVILLFSTAIALMGCAEDSFTKPGVTQEQYQTDSSECLAQAREQNPNPDKSGLAALFHLRDKCLTDRGYVKQ